MRCALRMTSIIIGVLLGQGALAKHELITSPTAGKQKFASPNQPDLPERIEFVGKATLLIEPVHQQSKNRWCLWNCNHGKVNRQWARATLANPNHRVLAVSVVKRCYAVFSPSGKLCLRHLDSRRLIRTMSVTVDPDNIVKAGFSRRGKYLVLGLRTRFLELHDTQTGKQTARLAISRYFLECLLSLSLADHFSPDDSKFVYYLDNGVLAVVDSANGKQLRTLGNALGNTENGEHYYSNLVRFAPNRPYLIEGTNFPAKTHESHDVFRIWNVETGALIQRIRKPAAWHSSRPRLRSVALSPDLRLLAFFQSWDNTIHIWETATDMPRGRLAGHGQHGADLAFSPDGKRLASSSYDSTVAIWDIHRPLQPVPRKPRLSAQELNKHWQALSQPDAKQAEAAMWSLIYGAKDSLPFLQKRLSPVFLPKPQRLKKLFDELDSNRFQIRVRAAKEIREIGEILIPSLRLELTKTNTLEKHMRLKQLLVHAEKGRLGQLSPSQLRRRRAVELLEKMDSAAARILFQRLVGGAPASR